LERRRERRNSRRLERRERGNRRRLKRTGKRLEEG
jgi:hypothetical protein